MDVEWIESFLLKMAIVNGAILLYWAACILWAKRWVYRIHQVWFGLSDEEMDLLHYGGLMIYKLAILILLVVPYLVLRFWGV